MSRIIHLKSISDLARLINQNDCYHPLVTVVDFSKQAEHVENEARICTDFYSVMFKNYCKSYVKYGRKAIDFSDGGGCGGGNSLIDIHG